MFAPRTLTAPKVARTKKYYKFHLQTEEAVVIIYLPHEQFVGEPEKISVHLTE